MKPGYIVYFVIGLLVIMFIYSQFIDRSGEHQVQPIRDSLVVQTYPKLYDAIYARKAQQLDPFLNHISPAVRKQAWRALASTPVDSLHPYMNRALESELQESWLALSMHEHSEDQIRLLEDYWLERADQRSGISLILGRQGDREALEFLLKYLEEASGSPYEYDFALAIGRLSVNHVLEPDLQQRVIERAFLSEDPALIRAYLYGFYRGNRQSLNDSTRGLLYRQWKEYGLGNSERVDQYIVRLLEGDVFYEITLYQNSENLLDLNIQLAVELAQMAGKVELNDRNTLAVRMLLMHENQHVAWQTLQSIKDRVKKGDNLMNFIISEMVEDTTKNPYVWLQALETVSTTEPELVKEHASQLEAVAEDHPYFLTQILNIQQKNESHEEFIERIRQTLESGEPLRQLYGINALANYWSLLPENERTTQREDDIRELIFDALQTKDRGVAFAAVTLLNDEVLFTEDDFNRINRVLNTFSLPEDIEVYQRFGMLYKQRFEEQAAPVVDSLAALGYEPLNRSLKQAGWEVIKSEYESPDFRRPDWERIWELGRNPLWVLQTEKGFIKVEMHTLSAPATVSAIDSLTLAGAYNGVPFHRVIPNFVIQGGDIERQDGYGGPNFIIPTEASEAEFRRGAAGIASAGNDTEGSQYFFMHQWKPHLNGGYTLFGKVAEGMDVVDRILPGDKVLYAYWE